MGEDFAIVLAVFLLSSSIISFMLYRFKNREWAFYVGWVLLFVSLSLLAWFGTPKLAEISNDLNINNNAVEDDTGDRHHSHPPFI